MLFLYLLNALIFFPSLLSFDKCLTYNQDNICLVCSSNFYEKRFSDYLQLSITKKTILLNNDCLEKNEKKLERKILIKNDANYISLISYDDIYFNIASALETETKIMAK